VQEIDSFILVGGRSSRFGANKVDAEVGGKTLAERALDVVRNSLPTTRITMVAGSSTPPAIEAVVLGVPFIYDLYPDRGPLGGLHAALANARTCWIFVLACDYPFVSVELIQLLAGNMSDEFGAIVPEQEDGRMQPLCAFYNVGLTRPIVEETIQLARPSPPLHKLVRKLPPRVVRFDEYSHLEGAEDAFFNINRQSDLEQANVRLKSGF
jgi:molybdopterin-guanine dinucleotide biosynthesis protein A